ncbi:hypothetical protein [Marasmitruncus massiliensis]|uniref:hypothetical protein n=1 Tax=Marasmitruncus massiliensis TaxID=1944642 RepID=UPI0011AF92A0|nr:hypothetical protein [Marasmitruncus massiliensis]MBE6907203.1 hypothetical protein [Oscillospiraceae bacterium]
MSWNTYNLDKIYQQMTAKPVSQRRERLALRPFHTHFGLNHLLAGLFLLGMLAGTLLIRNADSTTITTMQAVLGGYIERRQTASFLGVAAATFSSLFVMLVLLFVCGFCTISQPIIIFVPIFKGLGYGFSIGMLYAQYGFSAIRYILVLLFPVLLMGTCLLILACRASLLMAVSLFRMTLLAQQQTDSSRVRRYCMKFVAFTVICLLISLIDAVLFYKLGGLITL